MALELGPVAQLAAEFLDELESEYGSDAELVRVAVIVEIDHGDDENTVETKSHDLTKGDNELVGPTERAGLMARALAAELVGDGA